MVHFEIGVIGTEFGDGRERDLFGGAGFDIDFFEGRGLEEKAGFSFEDDVVLVD